MPAMKRVVSFKIPEEAADLQVRLSITSKKAGGTVWELMYKMLDLWDQQAGDTVGDGWKEWRDTVEAELRSLRADVESVRVQEKEYFVDQNTDIPLGEFTLEKFVEEPEIKAVDQDQSVVKTKQRTRKRRKEDS